MPFFNIISVIFSHHNLLFSLCFLIGPPELRISDSVGFTQPQWTIIFKIASVLTLFGFLSCYLPNNTLSPISTALTVHFYRSPREDLNLQEPVRRLCVTTVHVMRGT